MLPAGPRFLDFSLNFLRTLGPKPRPFSPMNPLSVQRHCVLAEAQTTGPFFVPAVLRRALQGAGKESGGKPSTVPPIGGSLKRASPGIVRVIADDGTQSVGRSGSTCFGAET